MFYKEFYFKLIIFLHFIECKILNISNIKIFTLFLLLFPISYAQEKTFIEFDLQEEGWVINDEYKNSSIQIILKPDLDYKTSFSPFPPIKHAFRPEFKDKQKLRYEIRTNLKEKLFISTTPFYVNSFLKKPMLPKKNPTYLFTSNSKNMGEDIIELYLATEEEGNIKSYFLHLDKTSNTANAYLDYLEAVWNEHLKAQNIRAVTLMVMLTGAFIAAIFLLIYLTKKLVKYLRIKKGKIVESQRNKQIRETVKNIVLEETIKQELSNQEPDELIALKKEIAKAITDGDESKIEYLLKLAERLKKMN